MLRKFTTTRFDHTVGDFINNGIVALNNIPDKSIFAVGIANGRVTFYDAKQDHYVKHYENSGLYLYDLYHVENTDYVVANMRTNEIHFFGFYESSQTSFSVEQEQRGWICGHKEYLFLGGLDGKLIILDLESNLCHPTCKTCSKSADSK